MDGAVDRIRYIRICIGNRAVGREGNFREFCIVNAERIGRSPAVVFECPGGSVGKYDALQKASRVTNFGPPAGSEIRLNGYGNVAQLESPAGPRRTGYRPDLGGRNWPRPVAARIIRCGRSRTRCLDNPSYRIRVIAAGNDAGS